MAQPPEFQIAAPGSDPATRPFLMLLGRRLTPTLRKRLAALSLRDAGLSRGVCEAVAPMAIISMLDLALAWPWQIDRFVAAGISRPRLAAVLIAAIDGEIAADPQIRHGREFVVDPVAHGVDLANRAIASRQRRARTAAARIKRGGATMRVAQLRIALLEIEPSIWRRVQVPASITLRRLHDVVQRAMGWSDSHLHQFEIGGVVYGMVEPAAEPSPETKDDRRATLADVAGRPGASIIYQYDFGDDWQHEIVVEDVRDAGVAARRALCLDGARACPPEDCGGPHQYAEVLIPALVTRRPTEEQGEILRWLGAPFDPEAFDLDAANLRLRKLKI